MQEIGSFNGTWGMHVGDILAIASTCTKLKCIKFERIKLLNDRVFAPFAQLHALTELSLTDMYKSGGVQDVMRCLSYLTQIKQLSISEDVDMQPGPCWSCSGAAPYLDAMVSLSDLCVWANDNIPSIPELTVASRLVKLQASIILNAGDIRHLSTIQTLRVLHVFGIDLEEDCSGLPCSWRTLNCDDVDGFSSLDSILWMPWTGVMELFCKSVQWEFSPQSTPNISRAASIVAPRLVTRREELLPKICLMCDAANSSHNIMYAMAPFGLCDPVPRFQLHEWNVDKELIQELRSHVPGITHLHLSNCITSSLDVWEEIARMECLLELSWRMSTPSPGGVGSSVAALAVMCTTIAGIRVGNTKPLEIRLRGSSLQTVHLDDLALTLRRQGITGVSCSL